MKKEREKLEKLKKFEAKQTKQKPNGAALAPSKTKEAKKAASKIPSPEYVEQTPKGEKKSKHRCTHGFMLAAQANTAVQFSSLLTTLLILNVAIFTTSSGRRRRSGT